MNRVYPLPLLLSVAVTLTGCSRAEEGGLETRNLVEDSRPGSESYGSDRSAFFGSTRGEPIGRTSVGDSRASAVWPVTHPPTERESWSARDYYLWINPRASNPRNRVEEPRRTESNAPVTSEQGAGMDDGWSDGMRESEPTRPQQFQQSAEDRTEGETTSEPLAPVTGEE